MFEIVTSSVYAFEQSITVSPLSSSVKSDCVARSWHSIASTHSGKSSAKVRTKTIMLARFEYIMCIASIAS